MRHVLVLLPVLFTLGACTAQVNPPAIIPQPAAMRLDSTSFKLTAATPVIAMQTSLHDEALFLQAALNEVLGGQPQVIGKEGTTAPGGIRLMVRNMDGVPDEGYKLVIRKDSVQVIAPTDAGVFHGLQTLIQLMPKTTAPLTSDLELPCLEITDAPRFPWRGMHLDVCRHFFPVDFVKRYIDLLARYKMNRFHWHLTDDQGWRIEIKKYPKLTEVGAWRSGSQYGPYAHRTYDSTRYGGFYTQEQIREVVAYATARHITVVPEIEMPGHALAALAAYPELSCTGGPFEVQKGWGVFDDVFCPKEETFTFLQNVLSEVIALFPSEYIHIGGDECPHVRWKACASCQALMKKEGLKNEEALQSYFIKRIEKFVNGKGRKIIGWDEILDGGLAPNAAVMSWRGTEGGVAAAKQKHEVVMCPGTHCYFDHYQGEPASEPLAIGGFSPVQKVYGYEPVPEGLTAEEAKYILGAQGNVWTEYIASPEHVEYMALPRMAALAEVLWSPANLRDEGNFVRRLEREFAQLDAMHVNYSKSLYNVGFTLRGSKKRGQVNVDLAGPAGLGETHYTTDGSEPTAGSPPFIYTIEQRGSTVIKAALFRDGKKLGNTTSRTLNFNKATGCALTVEPRPDERYNDGGIFTLVDGVSAGDRRVNTEWLGWRNGKVTITVDLGSEQTLEHADIGGLDERMSWIHAPQSVSISTSSDGQVFSEPVVVKSEPDARGRMAFGLELKGRSARHVRFIVQNLPSIPEGWPGAGNLPWLFLDEIHVR